MRCWCGYLPEQGADCLLKTWILYVMYMCLLHYSFLFIVFSLCSCIALYHLRWIKMNVTPKGDERDRETCMAYRCAGSCGSWGWRVCWSLDCTCRTWRATSRCGRTGGSSGRPGSGTTWSTTNTCEVSHAHSQSSNPRNPGLKTTWGTANTWGFSWTQSSNPCNPGSGTTWSTTNTCEVSPAHSQSSNPRNPGLRTTWSTTNTCEVSPAHIAAATLTYLTWRHLHLVHGTQKQTSHDIMFAHNVPAYMFCTVL